MELCWDCNVSRCQMSSGRILDPEPDLETPLNSTMRFRRQKISFANKILVYGVPKVDGGWKNFEFCEVLNQISIFLTFLIDIHFFDSSVWHSLKIHLDSFGGLRLCCKVCWKCRENIRGGQLSKFSIDYFFDICFLENFRCGFM